MKNITESGWHTQTLKYLLTGPLLGNISIQMKLFLKDKGNKSITKRQILHDFTYIKNLYWESYTEKVEWCCPRLGEKSGAFLLNGYELQFCKMKRILKMNDVDGCPKYEYI